MARKPVSHELIGGPYRTPLVRIGDEVICSLRGRVTVGSFSDGRIAWPISKQTGSPLIMFDDLERAVRTESATAIMHWWGVRGNTISKWRRALGVEMCNPGSRRLWSAWKPHNMKLPETFAIDRDALRAKRMRLGLYSKQVARRMGWSSPSAYGQYEEGRRLRATADTIERLAKVLKCRPRDLRKKA